MNTIDHNGLLLQMRALAERAKGIGDVGAANLAGGPAATNGVDFSRVLRTALDGVNAAQQTAATQSQRFESGDPSVDLSSVMVSIPKANVSFQAATQVRNKLVSAYQDIMNMQI